MADENAVVQYWKAINAGEINAGKWIRLLYDVIMEGITDKRWFFDERKGNNAIAFIERFCHHFKESWHRAALNLNCGSGHPSS